MTTRNVQAEYKRRKEIRAKWTPERRRIDLERSRSWRRRNFAKSKLLVKERGDNTNERHAAAVAFLAGHTHTCVRCPRKYSCTNACDPIGEGVKTSICPSCYEEAQHA